jgi:hypothetical protein
MAPVVLSRSTRGGYVTGQLGEAVLLPGDRPLSPARLLLVGVGSATARGGRPVLRAMRSAAAKLLMMKSPVALLACPGSINFCE